MARPVSDKIRSVRAELRARLASHAYRPGESFFSNRGLARHFGISYESAQKLLSELTVEGLLVRKLGSGTVVAGQVDAPELVELCFNTRAKRPGSFGHRLLGMLEQALSSAGINYSVSFASKPRPKATSYPVVWEVEDTGALLRRTSSFCLMLNARPAVGVDGRRVDSISVDDFGGGLAAGEILRDVYQITSPSMLAGPSGDPRNEARVAGFRHIFPAAKIISAEAWDAEPGSSCLKQVDMLASDGVFCANDRLAASLYAHQQTTARRAEQAEIIGFDDAPVAQEIGLSTIAIPWGQLVESALEIIRCRMSGDTASARHQSFPVQPILREPSDS